MLESTQSLPITSLSHVPASEEAVRGNGKEGTFFETGKIAVVTGADANNIGRGLALMLAKYGADAVGIVGHPIKEPGLMETADLIRSTDRWDGAKQGCEPIICAGDVTNTVFRKETFDRLTLYHNGTKDVPRLVLPFAGVIRDQRAVKIDPATGKAILHNEDDFDLVYQVNDKALHYWCLEFIGRIAELLHENHAQPNGQEGIGVLPGSVSDVGFPGQLAYSRGKGAMQASQAILNAEGKDFGAIFKRIRMGFVDSEMTRTMRQKALQAALQRTVDGRTMTPQYMAEGVHDLINDPNVLLKTIDNGFEDHHAKG